MHTIKHVGRDGLLILAFVAFAYAITLLVQLIAGLVIDIGEMLL